MAKATATKDFVPFVKNAVLLLLFASSLLTIVNGSCDDCEENQVCCNGVCIDGSTCFGLSCSSITDCADEETCCHNVCVNGSGCIGEFCRSDRDCGFPEGCCSGKCKNGYGCVGLSCSSDSDCGNFENCCGGTCSYRPCTDVDVWFILGSIFGSLLIIFAISLCVHFIYRRRRPGYRRVVEGQTILGQQGYPPPQYVQYPPHNAWTTKSSEPPPPYSGAPEGSSGGPQNMYTYGAVPNPSQPVYKPLH